MRKLMVLLVVGVLGAGALAACSDGEADDAGTSTTEGAESDRTTPDEAPTAEDGDGDGGDPAPSNGAGEVVSLDGWVDEFCTNFVTWLDDRKVNLEGIDTSIAVTDYPAQKAALVDFYEGEAEAASALVDRLEQGSVPELDDGQELVDVLIAIFEELRSAGSDAAEAVRALDTGSSTFEAAGQEINLAYQASLEATGDRFLEIADEYPDLADSATLEEQCVS